MILALTSQDALNLAYLLAAVAFIMGLKMLSRVATATRGNRLSALGMLIAIAATFFTISGGTSISLIWIAIGLLIGGAIGAVLALRVPMTSMPQMVALLNGFGGIASLLVAAGSYHRMGGNMNWDGQLATGLAVLIGGVTLTGSLMAYGKLQGVKWAPDQPVQLPGHRVMVLVGIAVGLILTALMAFSHGGDGWAFAAMWLIVVLALALGVLLVIGIGGADMPVVVALLNSYSGIAAAMAGFVLGNVALIITGALVGASGLILTRIMCTAMNRSLANVLFGGVGGTPTSGGSDGITGEARSASPADAAILLEAARSVIIVPGYGMAVAQAQHTVKELTTALSERGVEVQFAIHPVAGRMPGHMNVLLAEAGVDYETLRDLEQINDQFATCDVVLVIGANDVTNPDARTKEDSPLFGMPILNVDQARSVLVIKRSLNPGFAGIQNPLFFLPQTRMVFGDGKAMVQQMVDELTSIDG